VSKFQRRSPLVNRGYYLRMRLVDVTVANFLARRRGQPSAVVNLGCGSEVLAWRWLCRDPGACRSVTFVDVDFPDAVRKKCDVVKSRPELTEVLTGLEQTEDAHLLLRSDQYCLVGCDLRDVAVLDAVLAKCVPKPSGGILFIAEASITYMEVDAADALLSMPPEP
jgi:tRNA wybutosine-synthesizing protein 4